MKKEYVIEFVFRDAQRNIFGEEVSKINEKFKIFSKKELPNLSIVSPFKTDKQERVVRDFENVCKKFNLMKFYTKGFGFFGDTKSIYVKVESNNKLSFLRKMLLYRLKKYCELGEQDVSRFFIFTKKKSSFPHIPIATNQRRDKFNKMRRFILKQKPTKQRYYLLRATLKKNGNILYEYDFVLRKLLGKREAERKPKYPETMSKIDEMIKHTIAFHPPNLKGKK